MNGPDLRRVGCREADDVYPECPYILYGSVVHGVHVQLRRISYNLSRPGLDKDESLNVSVDMIFTTKNVLRAVEEVKDIDRLGVSLGVPQWVRDKVKRQFPDLPQQLKAYINYFMEHDPVASWRAVIVALDDIREKKAADAIRHLAEPVTGRAGS